MLHILHFLEERVQRGSDAAHASKHESSKRLTESKQAQVGGIDIPLERPCDDYAHMQRATYWKRQMHAVPLEDDSGHMKWDKKDTFDFINSPITSARLLPILQVFDAIRPGTT